MLRKRTLYLQLFGEGGESGDGGSASAAGEALGTPSGENIPASIPEKARKHYQKAMEKVNARQPANDKPAQPTTEPSTTARVPYSDLIKSDEYKAEHQAYMEKTIQERFKKYSGLEADYGRSKELLEIVAGKYGVDINAEGYLENLKDKIEADDSYYEEYALKNDMTPAEARKMVTMERKVAKYEAEKAENERQEQQRQQIMRLHQNAEQTKARFPQFDLNTEMKDPKFRNLCAVTNGDTTAAYMSCHWNEIMQATTTAAVQQAKQQTAQVVASNKARPVEGGMSTSTPAVVKQSFKGMSRDELRAYAEEQRRLKGRR